MTQLGDELLIAYSDGQLSTRQREEIGCVLEHDPVTDLRLKKLQNTRQRLSILFEDILQDHKNLRVEHIISLPEPKAEMRFPAKSQEKVRRQPEMKARKAETVATQQQDLPFRVNGAASASVPVRSAARLKRRMTEAVTREPKAQPQQSKKVQEDGKTSKILFQLFSALSLLIAGLVSGYYVQDYLGHETPVEAVPNLYAPVLNGGWTTAVINHHSLLRRDVIEAARVNQKNVSLIRNQLNSALGMRVTIPDLSSHGLTFARAQILTHNNRKIAQITYLPEQGEPVSLYLRKSRKVAALNTGALGSVNMVHWAQDKNGFVLVGSLPHWKLIVMSVDVKRQFSQRLTQR